QVLSKLLIRFVEGIIAEELPVEHPLKTWSQQQDSNIQSGDMLSYASQLLFLLDIGFNPFKDVLWSHVERLDYFAELCQQFRVRQEGGTHRDKLFIVANGRPCNSCKVLVQRSCAWLVPLEGIRYGRQVLCQQVRKGF